MAKGSGDEVAVATVRALEEAGNAALTVAGAGLTVKGAVASRRNGMPASACFAAGTLVLMADGTHKSIDDIEPGDYVLAVDPETWDQPQPFEVTHVHRNHTEAFVLSDRDFDR